MRILTVFAFILLSQAALAEPLTFRDFSTEPAAETAPAILLLAQSLSCTPRRTCSQVGSCENAYWYLQNCSWGGRLDRDKDGIPCESICR